MLGLVSCFCCNGVVLSTEEILPNFGEGGGPGVCEGGGRSWSLWGLVTIFLLL